MVMTLNGGKKYSNKNEDANIHNDEFCRYLDNKYPTFDGVRLVLYNNESIGLKYKEKNKYLYR